MSREEHRMSVRDVYYEDVMTMHEYLNCVEKWSKIPSDNEL